MKNPFDENSQLNNFWNNLSFVKRKRKERIATGVLLLCVGIVWMLKEMDYSLPDWLFGLPSIFMLIGIYSLVKNGIQQIVGYLWIILGLFFIIDQLFPQWNLKAFILPFIILCSGVILLLNPMKIWRNWQWKKFKKDIDLSEDHSSREELGMNVILGGIDKTIQSKHFKGGKMNCFLGGIQLNLLHADFDEEITIEVTSVLGGIEFFIPNHWEIKSDLTNVLGGISDQRIIPTTPNEHKRVLHLKGTILLGGIEIKGA